MNGVGKFLWRGHGQTWFWTVWLETEESDKLETQEDGIHDDQLRIHLILGD
jgi:hypothetical protein